MNVLLFARARDLAGRDSVAVAPPAATVAELRARLAHQFPDLAALLAHSAIAVNQEFAADSHPLSENDEIAVIPPVSGG